VPGTGWAEDDLRRAPDRGGISDSIERHERAIALLADVGDEPELLAQAKSKLGTVHWNVGNKIADADPVEALHHLLQAAELWDETEPLSEDLARCHALIGRLALAAGQLDLARSHHVRRLEIWETVAPGSERAANALSDVAQVLIAQDELPRAEALLRRALAIDDRESPNTERHALGLTNLAFVVAEQGRGAEAVRLNMQALDIAEVESPGGEAATTACQNLARLITPLMTLGMEVAEAGNPRAARPFYERAVQVLGLLSGSEPTELVLRIGLGNLYVQVREFGGAALANAQRAMNLAEQVEPESVNHARALGLAGAVLREHGRVPEAAALLREALRLLERLDPESEMTAVTLLDLGHTFQRERDHAGARREMERGLNILRRTSPTSTLTGAAASTLGSVLALSGHEEQATEHFEEALRLFRLNGSPPLHTARVLNHLGRFQESVEVLDGGEEVSLPMVAARLGLADDLAKSGDPRGAEDQLMQALEVAATVAPVSSALVHVRTRLAELVGKQNRPADAIDHLERAIEAAETFRSAEQGSEAQQMIFADLQNPYQSLIAALYERRAKGDIERTFELAERSRARSLVDLLAERQIDPRPESDEQRALLERERELRASFGDATVDVREVEREIELLKAAMRATFPAYADLEYPEPLDLSGAQALLAADTLLLEFDASGADAFVWAVSDVDVELVRIDSTGDEIAELVDRAVGAYQRDEGDPGVAAEEARERLSMLLVSSVPDRLWHRAQQLLIVPEGRLHYLPFELLTTAPGGPFLGDLYPIVYAPSATAVNSIARSWKAGTTLHEFVGFGDPLFAGAEETEDDVSAPAANRFRSAGVALERLEYSGDEVRGIAQLFGARIGGARSPLEWASENVYLREWATEHNAKKKTASARFVHFATHALIEDEHPLYSGLALAPPAAEELREDEHLDDMLQAHELFSLRLSAEAVVCSACQTGLGGIRQGEGLVGFARALFFAGARCVVVSLWSVDDEATSVLMQGFYRRIRDGRPVAEALREARIELRRRWPDPRDWAAFVVVGLGWPAP
jgi:CHAT domain-containing protein/tetratricopeptide (TPR) repeat protein